MSLQPDEAAGGETRGEELRSPWQQHTGAVNREEGKNNFIVEPAAGACDIFDRFLIQQVC